MTEQLMPIRSQLDEIKELFYKLSFFIDSEMKKGRVEITFLSELFLEELLNEIYVGKYSVTNLNFKRPNYPAIDLGDEKNRISFQITVTNDRYGIDQKVRETVQKFFEFELDKKYSQLFIFIPSGFRRENNLKEIRNIICPKRGEIEINKSLFSIHNIWDFSNLFIYIEQHLAKIDLEKVISICKKVDKRPELIKYDPPIYHIQRTITTDAREEDLIQIIKEQKQVVFISEGGMGKTTELKHVVYTLSNEGWYCYFISMVDYAISLDNTLNSISPFWYNFPDSKKILFAFDGLDEIAKGYNSEIINEIVQFGYKNQNFHILVSHKKGYQYYFGLASNNFSFCRTVLTSIPKERIIEFIRNKKELDSEYLVQELEKKKLFPLCANPFYLINLIHIFESTGKIPNENVEILEQLIDLRIKHETTKKKAPIAKKLSEREQEVYDVLIKVASITQFAEKITFSNRDFQQMVEQKLRKFMPRLVLINDNISWKFEHSIIRDYLAAKSLCNCNWGQIKLIILTGENKVKSQWNNSYWFLKQLIIRKGKLELIKQLNEVIIRTDYVKLLKSSDIQLSNSEKNEVFYSIYKDYKEKEIVFYTEFSAEELAKFCQLENNQELIDFLLNELKPDMNIQNLYNIVDLFEAIKPNDRKDIDRIAMSLIGYLKEEEFNKYNINSSILGTYIKWEWKDEVVFNEIIKDDILIKEGITRSTLLHYLQEVQSPLLTANLILRCLKIRRSDTVHTSDIFSIKEAISALSNSEIITLLDELTLRNENDQSRKQERDFINVVKAIEERASILYPTHNEILPAVNKFVMATLEYVHRAEPAWTIKPFYEKHKLVFPLFKDTFLSETQRVDAAPIYYRFKFSGFLADTECLDWILDEYKKGNISDDDIIKFRISMSRYRNGFGYQLLTEKMNEITDGTFFPDRPDIYTETHTKTEELYAQAILDKNLFISYIEKAFAFYSKEEISWKEYWDREDEEEHTSDIEYHLNRRCLRDFMDNDKITTRQEVLALVGNENEWKWFQLKEHYELSKDGKLQGKNKQWIRNWCEKHESEIDFKNALQDNEEGGTTYTYWAIYYIQFCIDSGYYSRSKQVLLDLVSCISGFVVDKEKALYEYLQLHLTNEEINERIVQNLKNGVNAEIVLREYMTIIQNENLLNATEYLPQYILDKAYKKWNRYQTLSVYFQLGGKMSNVEGLLSELNFDEESGYDWYIIDEFIKKSKSISANKLLTFIDDEPIDKYKLAIRLIKCGRIEGLDIIHSMLKEKNSNRNYDEFRMGEFEGFVKFGDFKGMDIIPRLTDMILIHLQPAFKNDKWSNLIGQLFNLLAFYLSSDSHSLGFEALSRIEKALSESENTTLYQIVYRNYQKLRLDMDIQIDSECEIDIAIKKLTEVGIVV